MVKHCFTTKLGGISEGAYATFNTSIFKEDKRENVLNNLNSICKTIGIDYKRLVGANQIHGDNAYIVSETDIGRGVIKSHNLVKADALITNRNRIPLITYYADCVPIYILDTVNKAISLVHSGWKGTVQKIAQKTLQRMKSEFNTDAKDCLIGIGPSLEQDCFEVDHDVAEKFREAFRYSEDFISKSKEKDKSYIDLWGLNAQMLIDIGVRSECITVSDFCTKCRSDLFFSFRRDNGKTGSLSAIMELR